MSKKKIGIIIAVAVILAAAAGAGGWYLLKGNSGGSKADKVFVEKVSAIMSSNSGAQNRYSGVVEAQESWKVNKDGEREIKEVFVEEGAMVKEGDPLFEYDMEDVKAELAQAQLDLEGMQNEITDYRAQIEQLVKERNAASADEKYQYTADIQEKENNIKQSEYNIESKKTEMQKKQETIDNAVVTSKIAGVVKSINESGSDPMSGEEAAYMTILAVGDFRVKGTVSETNVQMLSEEQPVILRSRIDEDQTWNGTISKIDTQNQIENQNDYMYDSGSSAEKATKYPFYIALDSTDGLMLGQHLFIELDQGQAEEKEGIWLFEGYIMREQENGEETDLEESGELAEPDTSAEDMGEEDTDLKGTAEEGTEADLEETGAAETGEDLDLGTAYVWAADARNKLQKRVVELGEYDAELGQYEILSGLTEDDYIAFPMEGLYEGVTTVTNAEEVDYNAPLYNQGGEGLEGEDLEGTGEEGLSEGEDIPLDDFMEEEGSEEDSEDNSEEDFDIPKQQDMSGDLGDISGGQVIE